MMKPATQDIRIILILFALNTFTNGRIECPVIGIDLGTTNYYVSIYRNGKVEIIPNEQGNLFTPSIVSFTNGEILIGEAAQTQTANNPTRTIYDIKRLVGKDIRIKKSSMQKNFSCMTLLIKRESHILE